MPTATRRRKVRSTPFPPGGENCVRSLAPPFPNKPASLGFVGSPKGKAPFKGEMFRFISPLKIPLFSDQSGGTAVPPIGCTPPGTGAALCGRPRAHAVRPYGNTHHRRARPLGAPRPAGSSGPTEYAPCRAFVMRVGAHLCVRPEREGGHAGPPLRVEHYRRTPSSASLRSAPSPLGEGGTAEGRDG